MNLPACEVPVRNTVAAVMVPMTAEQRAMVEARLDELITQIRDLARRLDVATAVLPAAPA